MKSHDRDLWLFDLDGTLVDSAPDILGGLNHALSANGYDTHDITQVRDWVGTGARSLLALALAHQGVTLPDARIEDMRAQFLAHYEQNTSAHSHLFPGVRELLDALAAADKGMAVVTNKPEGLSRKLIAELGVDHYFQTIIGPDTHGAAKPDPLPMLEAMRALGGTAEQAVMIGDSITDVRAARAVQIPCVVVSYGYNQGESAHALGADLVVDSLSALI